VRRVVTYRFVVELGEVPGDALSRPALEWVVAVCADGGLERVVVNAVQDLTTRGMVPLPISVRVCELEPGADGAPCACPPSEPKPEAPSIDALVPPDAVAERTPGAYL
jgi:hypothetical protein